MRKGEVRRSDSLCSVLVVVWENGTLGIRPHPSLHLGRYVHYRVRSGNPDTNEMEGRCLDFRGVLIRERDPQTC